MRPRLSPNFPGCAVRLLAAAMFCAALAPAAAAQLASTPIRIALPPAAVLQVGNGPAQGVGMGAAARQAITATPGASSILTLSYRASQSGGAALTVTALPGGSAEAGIEVAVQGPVPAGGAWTAGNPLVSASSGPVVLWEGGPAAHGLDQRLAVHYEAPPTDPGGPVTLVYTLAVS